MAKAKVLLESYSKDGHILTLTLNRPEALNAFNHELLDALYGATRKINKNSKVWAVIITGSDKCKKPSFSAGADLKERSMMADKDVEPFLKKIQGTFTAINELKAPVIAAINGFAFGGGLELALACDIRIAAEIAVMGLTETSLAIIPGAGGTQRLPRIIGEAKAKELIFTAKRMTADEALSVGLVSRVEHKNLLIKKANDLAGEIIKNGPIAVQQAKFAINRGMNGTLDNGLKIEIVAYRKCIPTKDRIEGIKAFSEKRKPKYKGK